MRSILLLLYAAGSDYIRQSLSITFGPNEDEISIQVPIISDSLRERSETFHGHLTVHSLQQCNIYSTNVAQHNTTIEIIYNDCK